MSGGCQRQMSSNQVGYTCIVMYYIHIIYTYTTLQLQIDKLQAVCTCCICSTHAYVYIALYVRIYFYIYLHYCRSTHETYVCIYLIQQVYMQLGGRCYTSFQLVHYIQVYWIRQFMWLPPPPCGGGLWGLVFFDVAYEYSL